MGLTEPASTLQLRLVPRCEKMWYQWKRQERARRSRCIEDRVWNFPDSLHFHHNWSAGRLLGAIVDCRLARKPTWPCGGSNPTTCASSPLAVLALECDSWRARPLVCYYVFSPSFFWALCLKPRLVLARAHVGRAGKTNMSLVEIRILFWTLGQNRQTTCECCVSELDTAGQKLGERDNKEKIVGRGI
jgi:hypothetical protein